MDESVDHFLLCSSSPLSADFDVAIREFFSDKLAVVMNLMTGKEQVLISPFPAATNETLRSLRDSLKHPLPCDDGGSFSLGTLQQAGELYVRTLFNFQHHVHFAWAEQWTREEQRYINRFFKIYGLDVAMAVAAYLKHESVRGKGEQPLYTFSPFSFSFRARPGTARLSAGRVFAGQTVARDPTLEAHARDALASRGLVAGTALHWTAGELRRHGLAFHSLGWDFGAHHLKLYFFSSDRSLLPTDAAALIAEVPRRGYMRMALLSYSYPLPLKDGSPRASRDDDSRPGAPEHAPLELKVYLYPTNAESHGTPPAPIGGAAHMYSSKRGQIVQYDLPWDEVGGERLAAARQWSNLLDARGKEMMELGSRDGIELDTIAFTASDDYTLYMPGY